VRHGAVFLTGGHANGNALAAIPAVKQVYEARWILAFLVQHDGHQVNLFGTVILVQHVYGQRIVYIVAHVRLKNYIQPLCQSTLETYSQNGKKSKESLSHDINDFYVNMLQRYDFWDKSVLKSGKNLGSLLKNDNFALLRMVHVRIK
jgi:hypothetical protein